MKTAKDPRHLKRRKLMRLLFEYGFKSNPKPSPVLTPIIKDLMKIDETIGAAAPLWPIKQINRTDLAILRLAVFELLLGSTPEKVVVAEAEELAKEYGSDSSPSFVNGEVGKVLNA